MYSLLYMDTDMITSAYRLNNAGQILIIKISPTPAHPSNH